MNDRNHKPASSSSSSSHVFSAGLEEEVKFVKTREDVLQAIGQPDKKRKREDVPSLNNHSEGMPEAKRMKREEKNGPKDLELVTINDGGNPSILVMNFGVKKE